VDTSSEYYPGNDRRYSSLKPEQLPKCESLKLTLERVLPYWESDIVPDIKAGKRLLVCALQLLLYLHCVDVSIVCVVCLLCEGVVYSGRHWLYLHLVYT
jgi:hypothetical protein